jgi:ketosteroid isomerase-like protein
MSRENVEIVRGIYDALARRDAVSPFEVYAEDIVWDMSRLRTAFMYSGGPVYRGHEGVRQSWREGLSAFGEIDMTAEELIDAGDKVLALVSERETGRASGVPVKNAHLAVWTLAAGKVTRVQMFDERDEALDAAGLRG